MLAALLFVPVFIATFANEADSDPPKTA